MLTPEQFLSRVETFLVATPSVTATQLGIEVLRDPNFVGDIRRGRVPSLKIAAKVLEFIDAQTVRPRPPSPPNPDALESAA